jgi:cell division protein FtsW
VAASSGAPALRLLRGGAGLRREAVETAAPRPRRSALSVADLARRDAGQLRFLVFCLCGFGLVMVLASSSVTSIVDYGTPWSLFERQAMWTVIGSTAFFVAARMSVERVRKLVLPLLVATSVMLVVVLVPGMGKSAGGSSRWIGAGPISLQPSELMKLAFALFLADLVQRREDSPDHARDLLRPVAIVLVFVDILILRQPDMGTAVVLVCMSAAVLYVAGVQRRLLTVMLVGAAVVGGVVALAAPYRRARLLSFLNPFGHASTTGYQVVQSLVALGSGHVGGTGVGSSPAVWGWLPNAQTDFVFAVVGNQLGLIGAAAVVFAFAWLGWLGIGVAARATDRFSSLLATVITCWIVCQAMINIGGVVGALPETGIPLPFVSSGGSSLVVALAASGLLVNIARRSATATKASR